MKENAEVGHICFGRFEMRIIRTLRITLRLNYRRASEREEAKEQTRQRQRQAEADTERQRQTENRLIEPYLHGLASFPWARGYISPLRVYGNNSNRLTKRAKRRSHALRLSLLRSIEVFS